MMARTFNGTSDYGSVALDLSNYDRVSIALWLYWDVFSTNDDHAFAFSYVAGEGFQCDPNGFSNRFYIWNNSAAGSNEAYFAQPSVGWHHYVFTFYRNGLTSAQCSAIMDGVTQIMTQGNGTAISGNYPSNTFHLMARQAGAFFGAGRVADLAIWGGVLLGEAEASALWSGISFPQEIQPNSLLGYWPLCGVDNPEPDQSRTNADMTFTGTTRSRHFRENGLCYVQAGAIPLSAFE